MNKSIKKHVLITGGTGYIGSHIAKALTLAGDYRVTIIDKVRRNHVIEYCDTFINDDFYSDITYELLHDDTPDAIVHCAGDIQVGESVSNPAKYYQNNVSKTISFLNWIVSSKVSPAIIFSSSASVYGNSNSAAPITEKSAIAPINTYGHTKAMIEQVLTDFDAAYGLKSACLRYFNACGADPHNYALGQAPGASHIIARLLESKLHNKTFTLNGQNFNTIDGTCIRDYVHVWDLAIAHVKAIEYILDKNESIKLNLGTNIGASNQQVIDACKNTVGDINIDYGPRRSGDPDVLVADASNAHAILQWQPQYSTLPVIVESAWNWYNNVRI